ncbi:toxin-antitoxin system HicB family antitoxin [Nocardioides euryhalodurans]|uniref:Toxin-antitoxin system HicB family antitoxin n=1 Tax=Nocardioides euryhalodurans TaxID=2518370 RepID=A0A4V1BE27_9ACTN|nr:toxin-antitoxin system HicB family antitoxin [Nocardioides euryhalodurans]QBR93162.1 toxin-antitoxin system HicB family antitoxin [Nocardioides euryhalodurans]
MDITPYVESLRQDLVAAAEAGGDDIKQAAERLVLALAPATRLALMEAISQAAAEITAELPDGGVDVRLDGRELDFVVHSAAQAPSAPAPPAPPAPPEETDEGGLARVTLRIPESVKARAEEKAARAGDSLNTWLVKVVRAATRDSAVDVDIDLSSIPFPDGFDVFRKGRGSRRMTGWI